MSIRLYELAGAEEDRRFSPYCWRIRMALLHKGLDFEGVAWRFTDKQAIAFAGSDKVPVLVDDARTVHDSPAIAAYLEEAYPDRPSLFGSAIGQGASRFLVDWCDAVLTPAMFPVLALDIRAHLAEQDVPYYTETRTARVGMELERFCADLPKRIETLRNVLTPLRRTLAAQPFLSGPGPAWPDYAVFGAFQWARCISKTRLLEEDDPIYRWREAMLGLFDGAAGKAKGYSV